MRAEDSETPYHTLGPDRVLNAIESVGFRCSGHLLALNSYENRVYQVGLEDGPAVVAKFYRPGRWSNEQILEEHAFTLELAEREIPVVAPWRNEVRETLHTFHDFRFAIYPRRGGRAPELDNFDHLTWLGRFIGRIHAVGATRDFVHRPTLTVEDFGERSYQYLLESGFLPAEFQRDYRELAEELMVGVREGYGRAGRTRHLRLHGDCHAGNVLWTDGGPHFVDFDDARMGPAVQDLWMLLSGDRIEKALQLDAVLSGYCEFFDFNAKELHLIEPLRTLRLIHYAAWLARRWNDPAFKISFPWFNTRHYWQEHIGNLREQAMLLEEPPLPRY